MRSTRGQVYKALDSERLLQSLMIQAAHGTPVEHKPVESFALYISDYSDQLQSQLSRIWGPEAQTRALDTIRKIGALCVAAMEQHGAQDRKFPVIAKINGEVMYLRPGMFDRFDLAPVKAEGSLVAYDPAQKSQAQRTCPKRKAKKAAKAKKPTLRKKGRRS